MLECLQRNIENRWLDEIHLFVEGQIAAKNLPQFNSAKVHLIKHGWRVTYRDLFSYANQRLTDCTVIIANADIYFDQSLARLDGYDLRERLLCLSRWDVQGDGSSRFFEHPGSQDAWIFQAPIHDFNSNFHLGVPACDNRLAWEAANAGLLVSNPSRSLRAHHLHLSHVRRYRERQRLSGPTRAVPAEFLGTPWVWFVVPCMGRLDDVRGTIESVINQPCSTYVLVDYSCPDDSVGWVREHHPAALTVKVSERQRFSGAEARNLGAAAADDDGIVCFLDADVRVAPDFSEYLLAHLKPGSFMVPDSQVPGFDSALVCRKSNFSDVHGFDELFLDWGEECTEIRKSLQRSGVAEQSFPSSFLTRHTHHAATRGNFRLITDCELDTVIHEAYVRAKSAIFEGTGGNGVSSLTLRDIYSAIARRQYDERGLTWESASAVVAFRESMGYTIARLEFGASSHNNDLRPFTVIPERLLGRQFTQVVAYSVSPIEIEFLSAGKMYVLVGNDWDGYHIAISWLETTGTRESLPPLETQTGSGFEVWSLAGKAGDHFVLPTQVMLVADRIVQK